MDTRAHGNNAVNNRLLRSLPQAAWERLSPLLLHVRVTTGQVLTRAGSEVVHHHFMNRGIACRVKTMRDGRSAEIIGIGIEGMSDPCVVYGADRALLDTVVQMQGDAFRIGHEVLKAQIAKDPELRKALTDFGRFTAYRVMQNVACSRLHSIEERLCRWLLITHDSALSDAFDTTHQFIASMLGVQRSGVSIAAEALKKAGLIRYTRASVTIADRAGLEAASCECYAAVRADLMKLYARDEIHPKKAHATQRIQDN